MPVIGGMKHIDPNNKPEKREVKKCVIRINLTKMESIKPYDPQFGFGKFVHSLN